MGLDMISPDTSNSRDTPITDYGYRYIFSTEYVNPTKELYKKLEKYIDKEYRNYDDFVNGRQDFLYLCLLSYFLLSHNSGHADQFYLNYCIYRKMLYHMDIHIFHLQCSLEHGN